MGEYEKTYKKLSEAKAKKQKLLERIEQLTLLVNEYDLIIADCESYLTELDYIDNGSILQR